MLPIAQRLILRDRNNGEPALRLAEDGVDLLERAVRGLGVEEVDDGVDDGVNDGEDDIRLVADGRKAYGRYHHDHEVEGPVGAGGEAVGGGADLEGHNFGGVEPAVGWIC